MLKFANAATVRYDAEETNALEKNIAVVKQMELEQILKQNSALLEIEKSKLSELMQVEWTFLPAENQLMALEFDATKTELSRNLNIQDAASQITLAKANQSLMKAALFPEFSVGYFMQTMVGMQKPNNTGNFSNSEFDFSGFSVGIALPLFAGSSLSKAKAAKIQTEIEEKNSAAIQSQIERSFEQEMKRWKTAQELLNYYETVALPNAKEINSNADLSYLNGAISYIEYVNSIETAFQVRLKANESIYKYNQNVINLHYLTNQ